MRVACTFTCWSPILYSPGSSDLYLATDVECLIDADCSDSLGVVCQDHSCLLECELDNSNDCLARIETQWTRGFRYTCT